MQGAAVSSPPLERFEKTLPLESFLNPNNPLPHRN